PIACRQAPTVIRGGLGLAIVRSIMSLHQGVAEVKSLPGAMTVFRLGFPAATLTAPSLAGKLPQ
ncbi:hypothetical protein ACIOZM_25805, partial [Pseudomonas sp. NPDC087346]